MPEEQKEDVIPGSSPEQDIPVNADQEQQLEVEVETQPQGVGKPPSTDVDERGVPWRNRAMEYQRKLEETDKTLSEVREHLKRQSQAQQPQYSVEELEAFAAEPSTNPRDRLWAYQQIEQRRKEDYARLLDERLTQSEKQRQNQEREARPVQYVSAHHSDVFLRNENGQFVADTGGRLQWNPQSDKARLMASYLQDERLRGQPDAIEIAAKLAAADLIQAQNPQQKQQVRKLQEENKALQRKTLIEGGGQQPINVDPVRIESEVFTSSGKVEDLAKVLKAKRVSRQSA